MVVFGGANCTGSCVCLADVWVLDLARAAWHQVATGADVDPRYHHTLVAAGARVATFGGESYQPRYMYHNSVAAITARELPAAVWLHVAGLAAAVAAIMALGVALGRRARGKIKI